MSINHQLALFIDVVQQGSFSKAAAMHDMDNSLLSKQIKKLEAELGVQLLNRSTRSVSMTSAGQEIYHQAHRLLDTLGDIRQTAHAYHAEPKGLLRITAPVFLGQQYLTPVIGQFLKKYPDVSIEVTLDDRLSDIIADRYDLAFRLSKLEDSNLIAKKISDTHFALVASRSFVEQYGSPQTPEALSQLPAVIYRTEHLNLDRFSVTPKEEEGSHPFQEFSMKGGYKVSDIRMLVDAVKAGIGYTVVDLANLNAPMDQLDLLPLLSDYTLSNRGTGIYAVYPHRKQTKLLSAFLQQFQDYIGSPPFWCHYSRHSE